MGFSSNYPVPSTVLYSNAFSDTILQNDSEQSTNATIYTKLKSIRLDRLDVLPGITQISVYFELKSAAGAHTAYAQIYNNGAAVGTERSDAGSGAYTAYTENITAGEGATIQIYAKNSNGLNVAYVKNLRILGRYVQAYTNSNP